MNEGLENLRSFVSDSICFYFNKETVMLSSLIMRTYIKMYILICMYMCALMHCVP